MVIMKCSICEKEVEWDSVKDPLCQECSKNPVIAEWARSMLRAVKWHSARWSALHRWQRTIPDPYRAECCEILFNGEVSDWRKRLLINAADEGAKGQKHNER